VLGVPIMNDPRACTWSAANHICGNPGAPAAPLCLDAIQAAGVDQAWDGPRNRFGRRIWGPYDRGINVGSSTTLSDAGSSTAQVSRWNHFDNNFAISNLYLDQESVDLAARAGADVSKAVIYENEATLGSLRTADQIDDNDPSRLDIARRRGVKIIVYHGTQDPLIQFRNDIDFYNRVAAHFGTPESGGLDSWYRLFLVPNAAHCPSVPNALPALIDWVENGVAPDSLVEPAFDQGSPVPLPPGLGLPPGFGGATTTIPRLCPFPQKALYLGGATDDASSYACGGDLQTKQVVCDGLRTVYKHENEDTLQTFGRFALAMCGDPAQASTGDRGAAGASR